SHYSARNRNNPSCPEVGSAASARRSSSGWGLSRLPIKCKSSQIHVELNGVRPELAPEPETLNILAAPIDLRSGPVTVLLAERPRGRYRRVRRGRSRTEIGDDFIARHFFKCAQSGCIYIKSEIFAAHSLLVLTDDVHPLALGTPVLFRAA